jgi:hypothetical protein
MNVARRRLLQALALAAPAQAQQQQGAAPLTSGMLRSAATIHGTNLTDERLEAIRPVIERRLAQQLKTLRSFEIDDAVEPTQAPMSHGRI